MVLEVRAGALDETRLVEESLEPADGQALLRVVRFGITANNVTYALLGDVLGFTKYYPAADGWRRVPAWGVAEVVATRSDAVREGERYFGYVPMASDVLLSPKAAASGVIDTSEHRASLLPVYNFYSRPDEAHQDEQIVLRPLFTFAFLLDEDLAARDVNAVVLSSASSKTASAIAFLLAARGCEVIGLTSGRNEAFVRGLGVYDETVVYGAIDTLAKRPVAFIDVAGDDAVRRQVHEHFRDDLVYSGMVGATHLDISGFAAPAVEHGPQPEPVSANAMLRARGRGLDADLAPAWARYADWAAGWLTVRHGSGPEAVRDAYLEVLRGGVAPHEAHIVSMA